MAAPYLRPIGIQAYAPDRPQARREQVIRIASRDDLGCTGFELIQRHPDDWIDRRLLSIDELRNLLGHPAPGGDRLQQQLERITSQRASLCGLSLDRPRIMGIVNVTPDSFSDGGRFATQSAAIDHALRLADEGADILDIGGESTRPGADAVTLDEELRRVMPVIEGLAGRTHARLSIDTRKAEVMRRAASAGVDLINDISALTHDPQSLRVAVETKLPVVLMHSPADPKVMQRNPVYRNALLDVFDALEARIEACMRAGIAREKLIVDPGIGFGKTTAHNLEILSGLSLFHSLGTPILLGASRKSFIGALTGAVDPEERLPGSIAAALAGLQQGVQILRVHDVGATRQAMIVWQAAVTGVARSALSA
jgi:dihydropteroate synthase